MKAVNTAQYIDWERSPKGQIMINRETGRYSMGLKNGYYPAVFRALPEFCLWAEEPFIIGGVTHLIRGKVILVTDALWSILNTTFPKTVSFTTCMNDR
jgi:hypothetical protein